MVALGADISTYLVMFIGLLSKFEAEGMDTQNSRVMLLVDMFVAVDQSFLCVACRSSL